MKHIKSFLPNIHKNSFHNTQWKLLIMQQWESIIGSLISKVSIHKIYNNAITLGVSDSSWMQELYMLSEVIKKKINNVLDKPRIETVRFQYVAQRKKRAVKKESTPLLKYNEKTLSTREQKALNRIQDQDLVQALTRLLKKCHQ